MNKKRWCDTRLKAPAVEVRRPGFPALAPPHPGDNGLGSVGNHPNLPARFSLHFCLWLRVPGPGSSWGHAHPEKHCLSSLHRTCVSSPAYPCMDKCKERLHTNHSHHDVPLVLWQSCDGGTPGRRMSIEGCLSTLAQQFKKDFLEEVTPGLILRFGQGKSSGSWREGTRYRE